MSITLDGTNGITTPDVETDGLTVDTNTLFVDAANNRVGIGTSNPSQTLDVASSGAVTAKFSGSSNQFQGIQVQNNYLSASQAGSVFFDALNENGIPIANMLFTVDADGRSRTHFEVTRTGDRATDRRYMAAMLQPIGTVETIFSLFGDGGGGAAGGEILNVCRGGVNGESFIQIFHNTSSQNGNWFMGFMYGNNVIGSISQSGTTGVSYNTSSDYRLKENVTPLSDATDRLMQIPVHRFNFIADPDITVDGFLAHEVQPYVPEAITGTKDEVDAEGNPVYQGIDQSKLVPLLTAALQEALQKIDDLTARITALETDND